jgi:hypothetical protein
LWLKTLSRREVSRSVSLKAPQRKDASFRLLYGNVRGRRPSRVETTFKECGSTPNSPGDAAELEALKEHLRRIPLVVEALPHKDSVRANQQPSVLHMEAVSTSLMTARILAQLIPVRTRACCIKSGSTASFNKDEQRGRWCICLLVAWVGEAAASENRITSVKVHYLNPHTKILQCLHLEISGPGSRLYC